MAPVATIRKFRIVYRGDKPWQSKKIKSKASNSMPLKTMPDQKASHSMSEYTEMDSPFYTRLHRWAGPFTGTIQVTVQPEETGYDA
jgi:hypothetical protein